MAGGASLAAAAVVVAVGSMGDREGVVVCPLRLCTGTYCPGCGGSRAAAALVRGDVVGAWQHHPYVVLLAAQILVLAGLAAHPASRDWLARRWVALVVANAAVLVVVWALRLALGQIPHAF